MGNDEWGMLLTEEQHDAATDELMSLVVLHQHMAGRRLDVEHKLHVRSTGLSPRESTS